MTIIKGKKEDTNTTQWNTREDMSDFFRTLNSIDANGVSAIITKEEKQKEILHESNHSS